MSEDLKIATIELILTSAIADYAKKKGKSVSEVRDEIIESGAYDALYDEETGLYTQGPDYFISYFEQLKDSKELSFVDCMSKQI